MHPQSKFDPQQVNDHLLIEWLKKNHESMVFTRQREHDASEYSKKLAVAIGRLDAAKPLCEQLDEVDEIWRSLLIEALAFLRSKDGRERYHHDTEVCGIDKLYDFSRAYRRLRPLVDGVEKARYRDHMVHMLSVYLSGQYFIGKTFGFEKIDAWDDILPVKITTEEKEAIWRVISLTHDLGIVLAKIPALNPKIRDILEPFRIQEMQPLSYHLEYSPFNDFMIRFVSSDLFALKAGKYFTTHVQPKYYWKFSAALEELDDGVASCILLMKNLLYFLESDFTLDDRKPLEIEDARQFMIRRNILRSVASHNCQSIYHSRIPELACLLVLFDEMHEWGYPRFAEMFGKRAPRTHVYLERFSERELSYRVVFSNEASSTSELELMKKASLRYFIWKCEKFKTIFRGVVGDADQNLALTFAVEDRTGQTTNIYRMVLNPSEESAVFKNNRKVPWPELRNLLER